jgi:hypothetical protein
MGKKGIEIVAVTAKSSHPKILGICSLFFILFYYSYGSFCKEKISW